MLSESLKFPIEKLRNIKSPALKLKANKKLKPQSPQKVGIDFSTVKKRARAIAARQALWRAYEELEWMDPWDEDWWGPSRYVHDLYLEADPKSHISSDEELWGDYCDHESGCPHDHRFSIN